MHRRDDRDGLLCGGASRKALAMMVTVALVLHTQAPSETLLTRVFTPRKENDTRLDTEKFVERETASVFPKVKQTGDAFENALNLIAADPRYLSEGDVRRMVRYFEWALEVPLVNSERNQLRKLLIAQHDKDGGKASPAFGFLAQGIGFKLGDVYLDAISNPFEDYKRRELQREYLPRLRREAEERGSLAAWLMARYEEAQPALTMGESPLRPQVVRAYVEHVVFCLNEVAGAKPEQPVIKTSPQLQLLLARQLVAAWPTLPEARRKELTELPFDWASTVKVWPTKSEAEKTVARLAWGKQWTPLFPELLPQHKARLDAYEKAKAQAKAEAEKREKAEAARLAKLTPQQRAAESLASQQLATSLAMMQMQSQFQMQQQAIQSMSQLQQRWHETNMNIINNMRVAPPTWRYEYVYR